MSGSPPNADAVSPLRHVRFGPKADIRAFGELTPNIFITSKGTGRDFHPILN
jgi:hypothetical protein